MYVSRVQHQIKDPASGVLAGREADQERGRARRRHGLCSSTQATDHSAVTCLWEADSVDTVQAYVDSTLGDSSENICYEVNTGPARGLPELAAATV